MNESIEVTNLLNCCIKIILNDTEYYNDNDSAKKLLKYLENNNEE